MGDTADTWEIHMSSNSRMVGHESPYLGLDHIEPRISQIDLAARNIREPQNVPVFLDEIPDPFEHPPLTFWRPFKDKEAVLFDLDLKAVEDHIDHLSHPLPSLIESSSKALPMHCKVGILQRAVGVTLYAGPQNFRLSSPLKFIETRNAFTCGQVASIVKSSPLCSTTSLPYTVGEDALRTTANFKKVQTLFKSQRVELRNKESARGLFNDVPILQ